MTVIPPITPIDTTTPKIGGVGGSSSVDRTGGTERANDFGRSVVDALDQLDQSQKATDELSRQAATGDLARPEDLMVSSTETQLATQLTVAVRNRALESFDEIMRMQL
jgi:flagellar hook-basal body complex protein FliE